MDTYFILGYKLHPEVKDINELEKFAKELPELTNPVGSRLLVMSRVKDSTEIKDYGI